MRQCNGSDVYGVAFIVRHFTIGGLERVVSYLANEYMARGMRVKVIVLNSDRRNALLTELDENVELIVLPKNRIRALRTLKLETQGWLVHINFGDGRIHPVLRQAVSASPTVVTYHSNYRHKRNPLSNRIDRLANRKTARIVAVSDDVAAFCNEAVGFSKARVEVIPNAVRFSTSKVWQELDRDDVFEFIVVANIYPHKNHKYLLEVASEMRSLGVGFKIRILGDGPEIASCVSMANELGVADCIEWYGAIWRPEIVQSMLRSADAFISTSRYEGMPLSVIEAMQVRLPIFLSDIPSHRDTAGNAAIYLPLDDAAQAARNVKEAIADRKTLSEMAGRSGTRSSRFTVPEQADRYLQVYRAVVGKGI